MKLPISVIAMLAVQAQMAGFYLFIMAQLDGYVAFMFSTGLLLAVGYWLLAFGFLANSQ